MLSTDIDLDTAVAIPRCQLRRSSTRMQLGSTLTTQPFDLVRLGGCETERPEAWREVVLTAIPKKTDKVEFSCNWIHQSVACDTKVQPPCLADRCQT